MTSGSQVAEPAASLQEVPASWEHTATSSPASARTHLLEQSAEGPKLSPEGRDAHREAGQWTPS